MDTTTKGTYIGPDSASDNARKFWRLLRALVVREFKGRYRRSILGPAWAVFQPLCYMVIFVLIRRMLNISSKAVSDVLDIFCVMVPWSFFANSVVRCGPSVYANAAILKKTAMPREVFPAAGILTSFIDLFIASVILAGMMVCYGVTVGWCLLWVPVLVALTALLAMGTGLGVAAVGTYKRDIIFAVPFLLQFWLLACPIMYPLEQVPEHWQSFYRLNPMVGIIEGFRSVLIHNAAPDTGLLAISVLGVVLVCVVTWPLFRYMSQYFADVL